MTSTTTKREAAFTELYRLHLEAIVNYSSRRMSGDAAVEVVAETFAIAWRRFEDIPEGSELPWLYGVARKTIANHRRGQLRRTALHDKLRNGWSPATQPLDDFSELSHLRKALESMSDRDRDLLMLAGVEELKPAEIAVVLDVSPEVAWNRLSRARSRLRSALESTKEVNHER